MPLPVREEDPTGDDAVSRDAHRHGRARSRLPPAAKTKITEHVVHPIEHPGYRVVVSVGVPAIVRPDKRALRGKADAGQYLGRTSASTPQAAVVAIKRVVVLARLRCSAKRAAIFSELLQHQILADMPHAQWVFSIPKMLRPYFLYLRELLGDLARLAYETVREMMATAIEEPDARPGMIAVIQMFGSSLKRCVSSRARRITATTLSWSPRRCSPISPTGRESRWKS